MPLLSPERALIFRLTHRDNLGQILSDGLRCRSSVAPSPAFIDIGLTELIRKRTLRQVPVLPGGTLADCVPFYFTPCTPMALNIVTGPCAVSHNHR